MDSGSATGWVRLTSLLGPYAETEANLLVMNLRGHGIKAIRLPVEPISIMVAKTSIPGILPIDILVPADERAEAQELLVEQPRQSVPAPLRTMMRWVVAAMVMSTVYGGLLAIWPRRGESASQDAMMQFSLAACSLAIVWSCVQAAVAMRRQGRRIIDGSGVATILLFSGGMWAMAGLAVWVSTVVPRRELIWIGFALLGLAVALMRRLMEKRR